MDFAHRVLREIPALRRYARALTNDRSGADDLVQECLCRALQKRHLFQPGTNLRAWLFTILHHQYVNHVRRAVREAPMFSVEESGSLIALPERASPRLTLRDLERALRQLPPAQRELILLVGLEGLSYERAAEVLAVPTGTVRSRLSRARSMLRDLLDGGVPHVRQRGPAHSPGISRQVHPLRPPETPASPAATYTSGQGSI